MRDGEPSVTAQRVVAYRLGFERVPAPYGDPSAVAALGEPVRTVLTAGDAQGLLSATGWRAEMASQSGDDPARRAGFVVAEPA